ncbi:hypothetical protein BGZ99_000224 [Dissophora globulifera]|uniref:Uncharacterized protein n=1 Tax=Dissophora globulifera TaxID=979702 RepID=A0A9P6R1P6_9FUNG|nr:hypothetical protein BGZ99_000224 [Dissophora globulifera]
MKVASTVEHPTDAVTPNNSNSSSSSIDNRSNALSPTEAPLLSAQSSRYAASSIAHMFSISPHDYHLIQEWAWSKLAKPTLQKPESFAIGPYWQLQVLQFAAYCQGSL